MHVHTNSTCTLPQVSLPANTLNTKPLTLKSDQNTYFYCISKHPNNSFITMSDYLLYLAQLITPYKLYT